MSTFLRDLKTITERPLIPVLVFPCRAQVREVTYELAPYAHNLRWQSSALLALQEATGTFAQRSDPLLLLSSWPIGIRADAGFVLVGSGRSIPRASFRRRVSLSAGKRCDTLSRS